MSILVLHNQQQTGPYSEQQVREMLAAGQLSPTDPAWRSGMEGWKPLGSLLADQASAPPPPRAAMPAVASAPLPAGGVKPAILAGGLAALLALGGVGLWQFNVQERLRNEQQQLAAERQHLADEQRRAAEAQRQQAEERRLAEQKQEAEEQRQKLAEEKRQAEERNKELEEKLRAERLARERQRRAVAARTNPPAAVGHVPPDASTNSYPGGSSQPAALCRECGIVQSIRAVNTQGEGSGAGAVLGGVVGGALGNQVGRGKGRTAAAIVGALGGAVAGHQIEKSQRTHTVYEVTVRFDDGLVRTFPQDNPPPWGQGQRVRLTNGVLTAN